MFRHFRSAALALASMGAVAMLSWSPPVLASGNPRALCAFPPGRPRRHPTATSSLLAPAEARNAAPRRGGLWLRP
jgi:hypothetical protein